MANAKRASKTRQFKAAGATDAQLSAALAGSVQAGMSAALVREILGPPTKESREASALGTVTKWHYPTQIIEFIEGKVRNVKRT